MMLFSELVLAVFQTDKKVTSYSYKNLWNVIEENIKLLHPSTSENIILAEDV